MQIPTNSNSFMHLWSSYQTLHRDLPPLVTVDMSDKPHIFSRSEKYIAEDTDNMPTDKIEQVTFGINSFNFFKKFKQ